jgi:hypothetical protein
MRAQLMFFISGVLLTQLLYTSQKNALTLSSAQLSERIIDTINAVQKYAQPSFSTPLHIQSCPSRSDYEIKTSFSLAKPTFFSTAIMDYDMTSYITEVIEKVWDVIEQRKKVSYIETIDDLLIQQITTAIALNTYKESKINVAMLSTLKKMVGSIMIVATTATLYKVSQFSPIIAYIAASGIAAFSLTALYHIQLACIRAQDQLKDNHKRFTDLYTHLAIYTNTHYPKKNGQHCLLSYLNNDQIINWPHLAQWWNEHSDWFSEYSKHYSGLSWDVAFIKK